LCPPSNFENGHNQHAAVDFNNAACAFPIDGLALDPIPPPLGGCSDFRNHSIPEHMLDIRHIKLPDPHFSLGVRQNLYLALKQKLLDPLKNSSLVLRIIHLHNIAHRSSLSADQVQSAHLILYQVCPRPRIH